jgi:hypothetical protein
MTLHMVDPTCRNCGRPLTDPASRAFRYGPECRKGMTPKQLDAALRQALAERDPAYVPPERPPSAEARWNNAAARAAAAPLQPAPAPAARTPFASPGAQLCAGGHGGIEGACAQCRRENDPNQAAARIIAEIKAERAHPPLETAKT